MATTSPPTATALASTAPPSRLRAPLASSVMVALDIDGTLLRAGREVPRETRIAVRALRLAGHHVVLASGRSLVGVLPVARSLGLNHGWVIASNGAVTARLNPLAPGAHTIQEATTFDPEPVARLVAAQLPETQIAVEETGWGYRTSAPVPDEVINGRQRLVSFEELWSTPSPRVFLRGPGVLDLLDPLRALGVTATAGGPTWVDVTPPDLSKATALDAVRQTLGIPSTHTIAVGDGINDTAMLIWAARGVAMGHAPAELKTVADEVTGTIADNGVLPVLRSLIATSAALGDTTFDRSVR